MIISPDDTDAGSTVASLRPRLSNNTDTTATFVDEHGDIDEESADSSGQGLTVFIGSDSEDTVVREHSEQPKPERKHYIGSSMDSLKTTFIPPVPMEGKHMSMLDENRNVSPRGRFHRQLRPLPGATSDALGFMSPEWTRRQMGRSRLQVQPRVHKTHSSSRKTMPRDDEETHSEEKAFLPRMHSSATASSNQSTVYTADTVQTKETDLSYFARQQQAAMDDTDEDEDAAFEMVSDEDLWQQQRNDELQMAYVE